LVNKQASKQEEDEKLVEGEWAADETIERDYLLMF
jgi:hypothetical protein